jgi:molecular chaperone GrpE (heat shock protein)
MPIPEAPKLAKWPFLLGDTLLVGAASFLVFTASWPLSRWEIAAVAPCIAVGAWLAVIPFLREHQAAVKLWEQTNLAEAAQQLDQLVTVANQLSAATSHWQSVQDSAARTVGSAEDLTKRMTGEAKAFAEFLQRSDAQEKAAMRLEIEKLRRGEGESLQVIIHLLDHAYALFLAGVRSGQPQLAQQIGQFRGACLDTVRRLGVVAHEARPGEFFDPAAHQTPDGQEPPADAKVGATLACGYTFQGQGVRRILVAIAQPQTAAEPMLPSGQEGDVSETVIIGAAETAESPLSAERFS